jgi:hypothetical protein
MALGEARSGSGQNFWSVLAQGLAGGAAAVPNALQQEKQNKLAKLGAIFDAQQMIMAKQSHEQQMALNSLRMREANENLKLLSLQASTYESPADRSARETKERLDADIKLAQENARLSQEGATQRYNQAIELSKFNADQTRQTLDQLVPPTEIVDMTDRFNAPITADYIPPFNRNVPLGEQISRVQQKYPNVQIELPGMGFAAQAGPSKSSTIEQTMKAQMGLIYGKIESLSNQRLMFASDKGKVAEIDAQIQQAMAERDMAERYWNQQIFEAGLLDSLPTEGMVGSGGGGITLPTKEEAAAELARRRKSSGGYNTIRSNPMNRYES